MSIARLMNQPLTVQAMGPTTQDTYGDWIPGEVGAAVPVSGYLEQSSSVEFLVNRDTTVTTWKAFLPATTVVTALSYINFGGQKFQVDGAPWHAYSPRSRSVDHIECKLVVVDG
jgi:hypothetical protein